VQAYRHTRDRVQRTDAPMQLRCGLTLVRTPMLRAGMAESAWTPPFSLGSRSNRTLSSLRDSGPGSRHESLMFRSCD